MHDIVHGMLPLSHLKSSDQLKMENKIDHLVEMQNNGTLTLKLRDSL